MNDDQTIRAGGADEGFCASYSSHTRFHDEALDAAIREHAAEELIHKAHDPASVEVQLQLLQGWVEQLADFAGRVSDLEEDLRGLKRELETFDPATEREYAWLRSLPGPAVREIGRKVI